ncbi:helix-turn-helix domain-containing protein [Listeria booriae]|uniref:Mga helix-turn-helix domain-containing protein n=1 Tax=Listeria booriae TaxID=1552123 RepID=A0A7X1DGC1_9LIST|nr:helix-turn-helix domain-containing protein [Listeria booriae]MBC2304051.1 hypothetical protein [Listeria booriae]MBC2309696.1 hypothetical protein [Listeria booriae]
MNHFCLRLIPDKKVHRQILLIEQIAKARYTITLDEISDTLNTSLRTLKRDVQEIDDMEEKLIIKHSASMLEITDNELVDFVLAELAEKSPLFAITKNIFEGRYLNIDEWADELYISTSTLYRHLNHFKKILQDFHLKLQLNPVVIEGREVDIRYFFHYFFYSTDDISHNFRPDKKIFNLFEKSFQYIMEHSNLEGHVGHRSVLYWIMVITKRLELRQYIKISKDVQLKQKELPLTYKSIQNLAVEILGLVLSSDEEVSRNEMLFLDFILLDNYVYTEQFSSGIVNMENAALIEDLFAMVKEYFSRNELEEPDEASLSIFVFFLRNIILLSRLSPLFQKNFFEVNASIKRNHGNIFEVWYDILKNNSIPELQNLVHMDDVSVNLTMFTLYVNNKIHGKKKHILFSFDGKTAYLNYLHVFAANIVGSNTKMTFLSNQRVTNDYIKKFKVDILVKNYKERYEHFDCVTYSCSREPNAADWDKVSQLVFDI